jgi:predicted nucleotidyltransferase
VTYSTGNGSRPIAVAAADVNGDSKFDIIVSNFNLNNVGVLLNTGTGTFANQVTHSTGNSSVPSSVAIADVNRDNKLDIIVSNYGSNKVGVLLNTGNGTFANQVTYSTGSSSYSVAAADVNGDSKHDIIVANAALNNVGVLLNTGTGTFGTQVTYSTGTGSDPYFVAVADVNGDSRLDLIVANTGTDNVGILLAKCS